MYNRARGVHAIATVLMAKYINTLSELAEWTPGWGRDYRRKRREVDRGWGEQGVFIARTKESCYVNRA